MCKFSDNTFFRTNSFLLKKMMCVCVLSHVQLFATLWTVAHQVPLSIEFSKQEHWSEFPFSTTRDLPSPGIKPMFLVSPALADGFFTTEIPGKQKGDVIF